MTAPPPDPPPHDTPAVMGILNVTPDSFSDGGRYVDVDAAVAHGVQMARQGAGLIDVGGESTRPGAERIDAAEQERRVVGTVRALRAGLDGAGQHGVGISIDTTLAPVAAAAVDAGASWINDVSAGREDAGMFALAAQRGVPLVLMHMLGQPGTMQDGPQYTDVVAEVEAFLRERAAKAEQAGVAREQIVIDPGIGFGKTLEHNLALLGALDRFVATGYPVMLGASRKRFIAGVSPATTGARGGAAEPSPDDRLGGTVATTVLGGLAGVRYFRVHEVAANRQALDVLAGVVRAQKSC